ncbi:MAG: hypothetical protein V1910_00150 [bacterium]
MGVQSVDEGFQKMEKLLSFAHQAGIVEKERPEPYKVDVNDIKQPQTFRFVQKQLDECGLNVKLTLAALALFAFYCKTNKYQIIEINVVFGDIAKRAQNSGKRLITLEDMVFYLV